MRNRLFALVTLFVAVALLVPAEASAQEEEFPTTVAASQGRGVVVSGREHAPGFRGKVQAAWEKQGNQRFIDIGGQKVGLAYAAGVEGTLKRVHVVTEGETDLTIVIGFYDKIATPEAVNVQETYECKRCGRVLVCSISPTCGE
jgi:hypothetical protein